MNYIDNIVSKLLKAPLSIIQFNTMIEHSNTFFENIDLEKELILSNGLPLYFNKNFVYLKTTLNNITDQVFCIVDIETTSSDTKTGQILEIGAIKYKNGKILETYHSLVNAQYIPQKIEELTGINLKMIENAPNLRDVLEEFKLFLEDDIFIAHNVDFDYKYISNSFKKYNLGKLLNRKLCTIELSKRTISAHRYGLQYLKEKFNINTHNHHRAFDDAKSTVKIFEIALKNIDIKLNNAEELIMYSHKAQIKSRNQNEQKI